MEHELVSPWESFGNLIFAKKKPEITVPIQGMYHEDVEHLSNIFDDIRTRRFRCKTFKKIREKNFEKFYRTPGSISTKKWPNTYHATEKRRSDTYNKSTLLEVIMIIKFSFFAQRNKNRGFLETLNRLRVPSRCNRPVV